MTSRGASAWLACATGLAWKNSHLMSRRRTARTLSGWRFSGFFKAAATFLAVAFGSEPSSTRRMTLPTNSSSSSVNCWQRRTALSLSRFKM